MKIFHATAFNSKSYEEIKRERAWIEEQYPDWKILDSRHDAIVPEIREIMLWHFGITMARALSKADLLVVPHDWADHRGIICEKTIAEQYCIPVIIMPDFEKEENAV
jgi:hypothetical protein